jgi:hypothetical protein
VTEVIVRQASLWQDAVRLLLLIDARAGAVGIVHTQVRLRKLHLWVRYPDYLANELLNGYGSHPGSPGLVDEADLILPSREPDLRRFSMLRHRFGAFEQLDNALSVLVEKGLPASHIKDRQYLQLSTHPRGPRRCPSDERVAA